MPLIHCVSILVLWKFYSTMVLTQMLETNSTTFMRLQGRGAFIHWKVSLKKTCLCLSASLRLEYFLCWCQLCIEPDNYEARFSYVHFFLCIYLFIFHLDWALKCFTCFLAFALIHNQTDGTIAYTYFTFIVCVGFLQTYLYGICILQTFILLSSLGPCGASIAWWSVFQAHIDGWAGCRVALYWVSYD